MADELLDCIPYYLMVAAFAVALADNPYAMHIAMMSCFWMGTARLVRGGGDKAEEYGVYRSRSLVGSAGLPG